MNPQGKLFRSGAALVAVATAFTTTAAAAPSQAPVLDPLVAVSVFGTQSSQAAVCAAGSQAATAAAASAATAAATTAQAGPGGCVLPVGGVAPPPAVGLGPAVAPMAGSGIGILPLLLGLAAVAGLAALLLRDDDDGAFDLTPISP